MAWIKRNLFFVVGGALALILLGGAGFYIFKGWTRNTDAFVKLNEYYTTLKELAGKKPSPGNEKINNTQIAKDQEKQVSAWILQAADHFKPIPAIPATSPVTSAAYAGALRVTVDRLQHAAESTGVLLPPKYDFSFTAQRTLMKFAGGSLEPLAVQLGEVNAICEILFASRINSLDSIQRVRVSDDDATGPAADYLDIHPVTNELAVVTPYVITLRCFTPELARVLTGFATAPNAFIVKTMNVQPAGASGALPTEEVPGAMPGGMPGGMPGRYRMRGEFPPPVAEAVAQPVPGRGGLPTVLKEQLLRVTIEVEFVKLLPKS
jgi:hypothetical protein